VLVDVVVVRVVEVAIMQIVYVAAMTDGGMSAARPMLMRMVGVSLGGASRHRFISFSVSTTADTSVRLSAGWSTAFRTNGSTCSSARA
jgi:hypothetical protein